MQNLLSTQEAAKGLGVSVYTVRMEIYRNRLPCVRVGRRCLISPQDLQDYIERNRTPARPRREPE